MKKIILIVFVCMLFGCSQSKEVKEGVIGEQVVVEDLLSYEINRLESVDRIEPSITTGIYSYYAPKDSSNVLLDLVLKVKNESSSKMKIKDYLSSVFEVNGTEYKAGLRVESDGGTNISAYESIEPMKTAFVHLYIEIAEENISDEILCKLTVKDHTDEIKLNRKTLIPEKKYLKKGDSAKKDEAVSVKIIESSVTKKLLPPNPDGFYTYYEVKDKNDSFLVLKMNVKNIGSIAINPEKYIGCEAKVDDQYEYSGFIVWERSDGTSLTNVGKIDPLKSVTAYCLVQVPDEVIKKSAEFKIKLLEDTYYFKK